jgi:hypothetical protein
MVVLGATYQTPAQAVWLRSVISELVDVLVTARIVHVPAADRSVALTASDRLAIIDGSRTATLDANDRTATIGGSRIVIVPEDDE